MGSGTASPPHLSKGKAHLSLVDLIRENCLDLGPGLHGEDGMVDPIVSQHPLRVSKDSDSLHRQPAVRTWPAIWGLLPNYLHLLRSMPLHGP